ncbi:hypothetical protein L2E82_43424 [Cichorium intybus]|uniref:Uncharacterized protein n=1 Tax=Cichorium intybus TaxID=13427 RepID=A0ACB8ZPK7_CICIN|nr:hypothetical protein L2E82_43424 [Cichorium intybus]
MRLTTNGGSLWMIASVLVVLSVFTTQPVASREINRNNTMIRWYCSSYRGMNGEVFLKNLNTTLSSLRKQLSIVNNYHAVSKTVINGESVYGLALCREYLPTTACLACFDTAVTYMKVCGLGNGAHIFYDDCEIRYENRNFYHDAIVKTSIAICGNKTSSHPKELKKIASGLLSDLQIGTPKTSHFFAASTRQIPGTNATVYATAQCIRNVSQRMCVECLKIRFGFLVDCLPSTFGRAIDDGCFMRYSETPFFELNESIDISPFLKNGYSRNLKSIIGGVVGGLGILFFILAFLFWHHRGRNSKHIKEGNSTGPTDLLQKTSVYTYKDLKAATNNFSDDNKIEGGYDMLYKGVLKDANTVAIKKIVITSKNRKSYFDGEIQILSNVHHRHLIRLLGYCRKGPHLYLVLEYMENGSLDKFLYGDKRGSLNWKQRIDIIYDFGLVKLLPEDKTHLSTKPSTKVAGTLSNGYIAPEYANNGQLSEKVDIYSVGVVILEIISGKRCNDMVENESGSLNLIDYARNLYEKDTHLNLVDATLDPSEYKTEDAKRIIEIALMCTNSTASVRPAMSDVVILLSECSFDARHPMKFTSEDSDMKIQIDTIVSTSKHQPNSASSSPKSTSN